MNFAYSTIIATRPSGELTLLRRPEVPITISGPARAATYVGLVDTGADNTVLPSSVAEYLQIPIGEDEAVGIGIGGHSIRLRSGRATLRIDAGHESLAWMAEVYFCDFEDPEDEVIVFGHAGFLDYFTAIFDGRRGVLTLNANESLPSVAAE